MLFPCLPEEGHLGETVLAVEDEKLGFRLVRLQVIRDEARAFVGAGRAAERRRRNGHYDATAIVHRPKLVAQAKRARPGLPGMRHALHSGGVIALNGVPAKIDPGRQDQPVVGQCASIAAGDDLGNGINVRCLLGDDGDPGTGKRIIGEGLFRDRACAADHQVAEGAGRISGIGL